MSISIAIGIGMVAMGAVLGYAVGAWGYYETGSPGEETWENMETGGSAETTWEDLES
jgi:hypothetical protein